MTTKSSKQASTAHVAKKEDWQAEMDHNFYEDERRRGDPSRTKSSKSKSNHEKTPRAAETSQERRERRLREKREREAIETERKERERDFARKRHVSVSRYKPRKPPAGYRDPNDVCRQAMVSGQVREERRQQLKSLMNCIAYEAPEGEASAAAGRSTAPRMHEMDHSLSSDTTSDITDVTPRSGSSSSGCSSMSKQSTTPERSNLPKRTQTKRSKSEGRPPRRPEEKKKSTSPAESDLNGNVTDGSPKGMEGKDQWELDQMRYLQGAFEDFDLDEESSDFATSIISGLSEERRAKCGRKNMTFTNEQLREIERVNMILLKKIMAHRKPQVNGGVPTTNMAPRKTSAALNRARADRSIEKENQVMLRKLQTVKGTTGTLTRKPASSSPGVC